MADGSSHIGNHRRMLFHPLLSLLPDLALFGVLPKVALRSVGTCRHGNTHNPRCVAPAHRTQPATSRGFLLDPGDAFAAGLLFLTSATCRPMSDKSRSASSLSMLSMSPSSRCTRGPTRCSSNRFTSAATRAPTLAATAPVVERNLPVDLSRPCASVWGKTSPFPCPWHRSVRQRGASPTTRVLRIVAATATTIPTHDCLRTRSQQRRRSQHTTV